MANKSNEKTILLELTKEEVYLIGASAVISREFKPSKEKELTDLIVKFEKASNRF